MISQFIGKQFVCSDINCCDLTPPRPDRRGGTAESNHMLY